MVETQTQAIEKMLDEDIRDLTALEVLGKDLVVLKVKTAQIRKFFGAMKRIQADYQKHQQEIILMEPRLAYAMGKAKKGKGKEGLEKLYKQLGPMIKRIGSDKVKFNRFVRVTEAIVAYHKSNGGEE